MDSHTSMYPSTIITNKNSIVYTCPLRRFLLTIKTSLVLLRRLLELFEYLIRYIWILYFSFLIDLIFIIIYIFFVLILLISFCFLYLMPLRSEWGISLYMLILHLISSSSYHCSIELLLSIFYLYKLRYPLRWISSNPLLWYVLDSVNPCFKIFC